MRTVVVGIDGSEQSLRTLRFAASLVDDFDGTLVVAFAQYAYLAMPDHVGEALYDDVFERAAATIERDVARELADHQTAWTFVTRRGEPASVLDTVARETGADFIVVGRHGSPTAALVIGSVSHRLVHLSHTPVLLVTD